MKRSTLFVSAVLFCLASAAASAAPKDAKPDQSRLIPVLVTVSRQGKVTEATPAYKLRPSFVHVIRDTLDKMITKPATSHGKPIPCQFVVNLAMTTVPKEDGTYGVSFKYISSKPLPSGSWYWVRTIDRRLALRDQQANGTMDLTGIETSMQAADASTPMSTGSK